MKKLLLITGLALLVSCKAEPPEPPEEQFSSVWRTTRHDFSIEVFSVVPAEFEERIKAEREVLSSVDVSEAEEYRLSFREDGTGVGSGFAPIEQSRYGFGFDWQSSDDKLTIIWDGNGSGFGGVLYTEYIAAQGKVVWSIEEQTSQKMVLSFIGVLDMSGIEGSAWGETHILRYTFERVK